MRAGTKTLPQPRSQLEDPASCVATAYDEAGEDYRSYADGDADGLFAFSSRYAYADRQVWLALDRLVLEIRAAGARELRILDAGCGPGTWLRRLVSRAHDLGFTRISARGFDIAAAQVRRARVLSHELARLPGVELTFEVGNMTRRLAEKDGSVDLCLCLYGVLNHVSAANLPKVFDEFARVTRGHVVTTVRAAGSTPTIFVDRVEKARHFKLDHRNDRCVVELENGRHLAFNSHLFTADELRRLAGKHFDTTSLRGLDLFHGRFAPDARWNPATLHADRRLYDELALLEERYAADPSFIDRAAHILLVARRASRGRHERVQSSTPNIAFGRAGSK
jgi:SAM-dependent methyltransferase